MRLKTLLAAGVAAAISAGAASAAVYDIVLDTPGGGNDFDADIANFFGVGANVQFGYVVGVTAGTDETLTFHGYGAESGFTNSFEVMGDNPSSISENNETFGNGASTSSAFTGVLASDDLKFTFSGTGGADAQIGDLGFGIYFDANQSGDQYFLLAYDDGNVVDDNHDDFLVKTKGTVNVVPLPAAGWMLLAGLGGMVAMRRRKS